MYTDYNYRYIVTPNKVIALSTYAGRTVRGIAKCHPNDTFDEEYGKKLAAARCNEKIAGKRYERAFIKYRMLYAEAELLQEKLAKAQQFLVDAAAAETEAILSVRTLRGEATHDN